MCWAVGGGQQINTLTEPISIRVVEFMLHTLMPGQLFLSNGQVFSQRATSTQAALKISDWLWARKVLTCCSTLSAGFMKLLYTNLPCTRMSMSSQYAAMRYRPRSALRGKSLGLCSVYFSPKETSPLVLSYIVTTVTTVVKRHSTLLLQILKLGDCESKSMRW